MTNGIPDELDMHKEFVEEEAKFLIDEADADRSGSLTLSEMAAKSELFVGALSGYVHPEL